MPVSSGKLYVCPTPIGNLEDITLRVIRTLREVDLIAAEDTRTTRKLLNKYEIKTQLTSYHEHNEASKSKLLVGKINQGKKIALVSESGMPGLSDPGYRLIRACLDANIDLEVLPGPSAAITALVASGLPTDSFLFQGFLPKKKGKRKKILDELKNQTRTLVFYESPHRIKKFLTELEENFGTRRIALARELTKKFEEVIEGTIPEIIQRVEQQNVRGEVVVIVKGKKPALSQQKRSASFLRNEVKKCILQGETKQDAIKKVASRYGLAKRVVYEACQTIKAKP